MKTAGIVLAAGASQRMGFPKALLRGADGVPLAARQARLLRAGGCEPVVVVVGAEAARVRAALPEDVTVVENARWAEGRATSLQAGLRAGLRAGPASGPVPWTPRRSPPRRTRRAPGATPGRAGP